MYYQECEMQKRYGTIVAIDWADAKHDYRVLKNGEQTADEISNDMIKLHDFFMELIEDNKYQQIAVVIENTQSALMHLLRSISKIDVYAVHPATASKYSETFCPSGAKTDKADTASLLDLLLKHPEQIRLLPNDAKAYVLEAYSEKRRDAVNTRTTVGQKLTALLKKFYPIVLEIIGGEVHSRMSMDLLEKWPTPQKLIEGSKASKTRFFNKLSNKKSLTPERVAKLDRAMVVIEHEDITELYATEVMDLHRQIAALNESINIYDAKIKKYYTQSDDHEIFTSFPGAGPTMGPRVMAFFGSDRERFPTVGDALKYSEIAPVLSQSGKSYSIKRRFKCDKYKQQTFVEFADGSRKKSIWAQEYYKMKKAEGKPHFNILRSLSFKWIRIMYRCWINNEPYDEAKYLEALRKRGSKLVNNLDKKSAELAKKPA